MGRNTGHTYLRVIDYMDLTCTSSWVDHAELRLDQPLPRQGFFEQSVVTPPWSSFLLNIHHESQKYVIISNQPYGCIGQIQR